MCVLVYMCVHACTRVSVFVYMCGWLALVGKTSTRQVLILSFKHYTQGSYHEAVRNSKGANVLLDGLLEILNNGVLIINDIVLYNDISVDYYSNNNNNIQVLQSYFQIK